MLLLSTMRAIPFSSLLCSHPAAALAPVRRNFSSISTVAPEKTVAATWVSGSLTFRPHEHAPRFHVLEHAPQRGRCRKGRAGPERHLAPAISSWSAGSLIPIPTSHLMCRRGALIALLWRFRMPLEAECLCVSSFSAASAVAFDWPLRSHLRCLSGLLSILPLPLLFGLYPRITLVPAVFFKGLRSSAGGLPRLAGTPGGRTAARGC